MNTRDLAWAAGLFEGEGSVLMWRSTGKTPVMSLQTCDEDVLRRFHEVVGVGRVNGPYQYAKNKKQFWTWKVTSFEKVQYLVAAFWPYLGRRRKDDAKAVLAEARQQPLPPSLRTHCPQGHAFDPANTLIVTRRSGQRAGKQHRVCKACAYARTAAYMTRA